MTKKLVVVTVIHCVDESYRRSRFFGGFEPVPAVVEAKLTFRPGCVPAWLQDHIRLQSNGNPFKLNCTGEDVDAPDTWRRYRITSATDVISEEELKQACGQWEHHPKGDPNAEDYPPSKK